MTTDAISRRLRIEGPRPGATRADSSLTVEYMGVRVVIASQQRAPKDRGVVVHIQTGDGERETLEIETGNDGTRMPPWEG